MSIIAVGPHNESFRERKFEMKRITLILLGFILAASLAACTGKTDAGSSGEEEEINTDGETPGGENEEEISLYGKIIAVNEETPFTMKGVKLTGSQHPAHPEITPAMEKIEHDFFLDEKISFTVSTDYEGYADGKAMVYFLRHRSFEEYDFMTYDDIQMDAPIGKSLHAPDGEGYVLSVQPNSESMEDGDYDVFFMYDGGVCYYMTIHLQPSQELDPDAPTDGEVIEEAPFTEPENDNPDSGETEGNGALPEA